jgi:large subunit ribosomal protein L10
VNLDEKKRITQDINARFSKAAVVIVTDYKGLDVTAINDLRRKLRKEEVEFQVAKNTLLIRASEETDVALIKDIAKNSDVFEIKAGVMNGKVLDVSAIKALSELPPRDVLLGQFMSVLNNLPTMFVRTLSEMPRRLLNVLQAIKEQKEAA